MNRSLIDHWTVNAPVVNSSQMLPSGTLTFLFTDIQGSTHMWEQYPEQMRYAMSRHDALIESAVEQHAGMVVRPRGEGDSRFAVFPRATDALSKLFLLQSRNIQDSCPF